MTAVTNLDAANTYTLATINGALPAESIVSMASFNRPGDTTAYTANDVVSDSAGGNRSLAFPGCGRGGIVHSATLVMAHTATTAFDLFLFESEPGGGTDNAAVALAMADAVKCIGMFRFLDANKVNMGTNVELYRATSATADMALQPLGYTILANETAGRLFGILVCRTGYTPLNANKFTIRLGITRNGVG
jgi:hypothetical protein